MRTALVWISLQLGGLALLPGQAFAQAPPSSEKTEPRAAPDIVMLNNGGLVRGTISELVPDDYVLIVTVTGDSRRIAMTEVKYAGPAGGAPAVDGSIESNAGTRVAGIVIAVLGRVALSAPRLSAALRTERQPLAGGAGPLPGLSVRATF